MLVKTKMNIFLYAIIFICGTMFGSFYTLAVYRIPKNIDIVKKHSYCPNCNHKLGILDLIPILSYIFLGGKCRYCKQKIRPRYLILETLSGCAFVLLAYTLNINVLIDNKIIYIAKYIAYLYILFDSITYRYIIYKSDIHIPYARTFLLILLYSLIPLFIRI